ncbi:hypothetical protein KAX17_12655 [Candidatus Bipolaricaulota bacterium]|nr:hypothetical protein [Candidatus Bipolaricaulota bacterium]
MEWAAHTLTYRAVTPVLLGSYPFGFVQRTRYYAPSWTLWGAITAQLTRACLPQAAGKDYQDVGRFVRDNLLTSYAYLLVDGQSAWPRFMDGQLHYGPLRTAEFEACFLTSRGQTAVAPESISAHTGTLHETEALAAYDRDGKPVRWQFTLYMRRPWKKTPQHLQEVGLKEQKVLEILKELTIGGDRRYGLGHLRLETAATPRAAGEGERPSPLEWDPTARLLRAHMPVRDLSGEMIRGRAEAIPWRWWRNEPKGAWGPGQAAKVQCFYDPGSHIEAGVSGKPVIGEYGIWRWQGEEE